MSSSRFFSYAVFTLLTFSSIASENLQSIKDKLPSPDALRVFTSETNATTLKISGEPSLFSSRWLHDQPGRFSTFVRVNVGDTADKKSYAVTAHSKANQTRVAKDDWLLASFYVRASEANQHVNIRGFIERSRPSWMMVADASVAANNEWTRVVAFGQAPQDLPAGSTHLSLHLASTPQTLDIADVIFVSLPQNTPIHVFPPTELTYDGKAADAAWRKTAKDMIDKNRKNNFSLFVLDRNGEPVAKTQVSMQLQSPDYAFGSMVAPRFSKDDEQGEQFRDWFSQFFNAATARIYWADWGWENPDVRENNIKIMNMLQQQDVPTRGHVLLYPAFRFSPQALIDLQKDRAAFIARVNQHIDEIVPILRRLGAHEYDVINELRDEREWLDIVGLDTVADWFKRVHQLHPEAKLYINENSILTDGGNNLTQQNHYYDLIQYLLAQGAPIHGIGMQGHFSGVVTPIEKMWQILDRFGEFGLPIKITEFDSNTRDFAAQAAFDTDFYEAMFAHPATVGVTRWGFYEPIMWRPLGALVDGENQFKANAKAYLNWLAQIKGQATKHRTDADGKTQWRGFYGRYDVQVEGDESVYLCDFVTPSIGTPKAQVNRNMSCTIRLNY